MSQSILIVDDEPSLALTIAALLRDEGYSVRVAFDGIDALRLFRDTPADLVISNSLMSDMSGSDLAFELTRTPNPPAVVLISAGPRPRFLPAEVSFLPKPFEAARLLDVVKTALAR